MAHHKISEVIFFPDDKKHTSLDKFLHFLTSAKHTLDICVFNITDNRISNAIRDLHTKGVHVRIITDDDQVTNLGSDVIDLNKAGIPVRIDNAKSFMHHKYAIVDGNLLISGSFNWTKNASDANRENVIVTNDKTLVNPFIDNYEHLWKEFEKNINLNITPHPFVPFKAHHSPA
eukprot:TRINITY_DN695_c0_g2_i2.p1 TRINITY_DN695_c0_g2~~TRINITY_DN695_c0_g2_i2.p1  ORF type:complete len:174 (-),score=30.87 TRINITY_DN695_c0_g2_i2:116-637(-)